MPGGKVVVYSGILPIAENEAGIAVIMGHEIAHAVAKHGNERMSQQLATQMGGLALAVALEEKGGELRGCLKRLCFGHPELVSGSKNSLLSAQ